MNKLTMISVFILLTLALVLVGQQPVEVRKITAAATGTQVAASSDSVVCASDTGCVIKAASGNIADGANATEGTIADAAASAGGTGTMNAHLRELSAQLNNGISVTASIAAAQTLTTVTTVGAVTSVTNPISIGTTTTGGYTNYSPTIGASDNHAVIKNGAGTVGYILAFNNSATVNYMRLYNAGTGFNGCNSATNLIARFQIPASTSVGGFAVPLPPQGMGGFSSGISICVTSVFGDTDTTAATASAISLNVGYN